MNEFTNFDLAMAFLMVWTGMFAMLALAFAFVRITAPKAVVVNAAKKAESNQMWRVAFGMTGGFAAISAIVVVASNVLVY
jgi:hypothetical protein